MRPPFRTRKTRTLFQPNSPPEGLKTYNEGAPMKDERESLVCRKWDNVLRHQGWQYRKSGRDNWLFIPPSLLGNPEDPALVAKHGTEGVHYCCGWVGLHEMVEEHGEDYAPPRLPQQKPVRANSSNGGGSDDVTMNETPPTQSSGEDEDDEVNEEPATSTASAKSSRQRTRATAPRNEDAANRLTVEDRRVQDNESDEDEQGTEISIRQEDDASHSSDEEASSDGCVQGHLFHSADIRNISATLDSIRKCREELSWLEDNPAFHGPETTHAFKRAMEVTVMHLYNHIITFHYLDQNESE